MGVWVAVYGTLKKGFGNHFLLEGSKFLGTATSEDRFCLGEYVFPAVVPSPDGVAIEVEIYEVDDRVLKRLDALEGYPDFYNRGLFGFNLEGKPCRAYLYFLVEKRKPFVWKKFKADGPFTWTGKWKQV